MYDSTITLFNYHKLSGAWYTTTFSGVDLAENTGSTATPKGDINGDAVEIIIHIKADQNGNRTAVDAVTNSEKRYIGPKEYAKHDAPEAFFTFAPETDFVVVGNTSSDAPISDDDYDEGLYHAMNESRDGVYMVYSAKYFGLLPHFEIGGR